MAAYSSASISATLTLTQKRAPTPCPEYRRCWGEFGRCGTFFLHGLLIGVLADKAGGGIKAVHCLHSR